jgi:hypothetical protein
MYSQCVLGSTSTAAFLCGLRFAGCFLTHTFWNNGSGPFRRFLFMGMQHRLGRPSETDGEGSRALAVIQKAKQRDGVEHPFVTPLGNNLTLPRGGSSASFARVNGCQSPSHSSRERSVTSSRFWLAISFLQEEGSFGCLCLLSPQWREVASHWTAHPVALVRFTSHGTLGPT